ncbi:MAG: lasso peptide biosynthesis B2 protein [Gemmatimonadales bacterium]
MSSGSTGTELPLELRARALWAAVVIPPWLAVSSFQRVASRLGRGSRPARSPSTPAEDAALAAFVDSILHRLPGPWRHTCLKRAAVLFHVLRRADRPVQLLIGVRREADGALQAHAWLAREGEVYLEPNPDVPPRHVVLARFPDERDSHAA